MNDYEKCEAYQIKKTVDGICIGNDGAKCEFCPAYLRYKVKIEQEGGVMLMTNMEKVIKGLECCSKLDDNCTDCPYDYAGDGGESICLRRQLMPDALALLKEQEKIVNELEEKLRLMEYGDQDTLHSGMMPAT